MICRPCQMSVQSSSTLPSTRYIFPYILGNVTMNQQQRRSATLSRYKWWIECVLISRCLRGTSIWLSDHSPWGDSGANTPHFCLANHWFLISYRAYLRTKSSYAKTLWFILIRSWWFLIFFWECSIQCFEIKCHSQLIKYKHNGFSKVFFFGYGWSNLPIEVSTSLILPL